MTVNNRKNLLEKLLTLDVVIRSTILKYILNINTVEFEHILFPINNILEEIRQSIINMDEKKETSKIFKRGYSYKDQNSESWLIIYSGESINKQFEYNIIGMFLGYLPTCNKVLSFSKEGKCIAYGDKYDLIYETEQLYDPTIIDPNEIKEMHK